MLQAPLVPAIIWMQLGLLGNCTHTDLPTPSATTPFSWLAIPPLSVAFGPYHQRVTGVRSRLSSSYSPFPAAPVLRS